MADYGLNEAATYATAISSLALRLGAYVFLRWPFPPAILALLAVYIPSFIYNFVHTSPYEVVADKLDIVAREPPAADEDATWRRKVGEPANLDHGPELEVEETIV
ncbi:hypothetical protein LTR48_008443, partial [Friedmanniomyces endolithicus]